MRHLESLSHKSVFGRKESEVMNHYTDKKQGQIRLK